MTDERGLRRRRLRAPVENGSVLVEPAFSESAALLSRNRKRISDYSIDVGTSNLLQLRNEMRKVAWQKAIRYTQQYAHVDQSHLDTQDAPFIVSGHQPQLFHPGVWFKNFALEYLRKQHSAVAIHVVIDNDLCRNHAIRVPSGTTTQPNLASVPFDESRPVVPFEERTLMDRQLFDTFGDRTCKAVEPLVPDPIVKQTWQSLTTNLEFENLGQLLSAYRHRVEQQHGSETLEVPLSQLCETTPFRTLFACIASDITRFHQIHNQLLQQYRTINRVRSQAHPVPDLRIQNDWFELPFWIWSQDQPNREAMFARKTPDGIEVSDRQSFWQVGKSCHDIVDSITKLSDQGIRIRPRAITNTVFLRLMISDLFLHGIGGAKYDELTDAIIQQFFEINPPEFLTLTATVRLPVAKQNPKKNNATTLKQQIRRTIYNPQEFLNQAQLLDNQVSRWVREKQALVATQAPPSELMNRHRSIQQVNDKIQPYIEERRNDLYQRLDEESEANRIQGLLGSREFSFCLFPEQSLRSIIPRD